jgi:hypothetical protein
MKTSLVIYCIITLLVASGADTCAQFDSLGLNTEWKKGSLVLDNNSTLNGLIQFNDKLGMIKFKKTPGGAEESFVETSIFAMQLYDEDTRSWRNFAVFNINEEETGRQGTLLFEVLIEFNKFALLTRIEPVNLATRNRQDSFGQYQTVKVGYEQFEKFCLVDQEGTATLVLAVSEFERKKFSMAPKLKPILDKLAIEKYLGGDWEKFQELVKRNKLNLKKRDDFIRAFEYLREATQEGS